MSPLRPWREVAAPPSLEELRQRRDEILAVCAAYGASNVRVLGSVARGEQGPDSDVDLLVDLEPGRSLFDLGGLLVDLEELLHCRVDVGESVRERMRAQVVAEAVTL